MLGHFLSLSALVLGTRAHHMSLLSALEAHHIALVVPFCRSHLVRPHEELALLLARLGAHVELSARVRSGFCSGAQRTGLAAVAARGLLLRGVEGSCVGLRGVEERGVWVGCRGTRNPLGEVAVVDRARTTVKTLAVVGTDLVDLPDDAAVSVVAARGLLLRRLSIEGLRRWSIEGLWRLSIEGLWRLSIEGLWRLSIEGLWRWSIEGLWSEGGLLGRLRRCEGRLSSKGRLGNKGRLLRTEHGRLDHGGHLRRERRLWLLNK